MSRELRGGLVAEEAEVVVAMRLLGLAAGLAGFRGLYGTGRLATRGQGF